MTLQINVDERLFNKIYLDNLEHNQNRVQIAFGGYNDIEAGEKSDDTEAGEIAHDDILE